MNLLNCYSDVKQLQAEGLQVKRDTCTIVHDGYDCEDETDDRDDEADDEEDDRDYGEDDLLSDKVIK